MGKDKGNTRQKKGASETIETSKSRDWEAVDYSVYRLSRTEWIKNLVLYLLLDGCTSYLFFASWLAFVLFLPGGWLFVREYRKTMQKKRSREIQQQFMDGIQLMAASLQAGYSAENALKEAVKEMRKVSREQAYVLLEFEWMVSQTRLGRNLEELFLDFGRRCGIEDIQSFAEVFLTAKRSGGDLLLIIRNTTSCIRQKQETMQEIETTLSGKVMEQNIMSLIPLFILAYIKFSSPEFLEGMYGNLTGTSVMSCCFGVYLSAYFWGRRIVQIEV